MCKTQLTVLVLLGVALASSSAFSPLSLVGERKMVRGCPPASFSWGSGSSEDKASFHTSLHAPASYTALQAGRSDAPPLRRNPPRKICLMVEPTPFTHVSGYANRFKEMLKFLAKAGDKVDILTVDSKTPPKDLPKQAFGYPVRHTQGFTFPLYNQISLTFDLPEMKGAQIVENMRPDLIHVTSPYVQLIG